VSRAAPLALLLLLLALPAPTLRAQDDDLAAEDPDTSTEEPQHAAAGPSDEPASEAPADSEQAAATTTEPEPAATEAPDATGSTRSERALSLYAGAGLGVGTLAFQRPTAEGAQKLGQTAFAAAEFVLRVHAWPAKRESLEVLLMYQTSLGLVLQAAPLFALPQNVDVRSQRVELSVAPVLRLGQARNAPALVLPLGFAFRSLFPGVHQFSVPKYGIGGPHLRAEVLVPLGELVSLRIGPEAQWLVVIDRSLKREGACCQGIAVGGQGSLQARVGATIRIVLAYGESHAFVPSGSWRFMDVERFLTARIAGEL
jgi:hypothetical protein